MSELPTGWTIVPLAEVAEVRLGRQRSPDQATGQHMRPYMRAANVTWSGISLDDVKEMNFTPKEFLTYELRAGDVLLSEASGSASEVGKPALWSNDVKGCCFQNTLIRVRSKGPLPEYLYWHFLADARLGRFAAVGKGVGINHLGADRMATWPTRLPPPGEQRRIVAKLEALTARSRRAKEALDAIPPLLERFRQSVLAAAFRGDLTADWRAKNPDIEPASELLKRIRVERRRRWEEAELAKMRAKGKAPGDDRWKGKYVEPVPVDPEGLPGLPEGWAWASVEEVCPPEAPAVYGIILPGDEFPGGVPYLRPIDINADGTIDFASVKHTSPEVARQYARASLRTGDVVLSIVGTIGKVVVVPPELDGGNITQSSIRIRPPSWLPPEYIRLALLSPLLTRQFDAVRFGNAVQRLNVEHVRNLALPVPPPAEVVKVERAAAAALANVAGIDVAALSGQVARLDASLLAKAFRGELVPQDPHDGPAEAAPPRFGTKHPVTTRPRDTHSRHDAGTRAPARRKGG